jgi:hypothetical protein
VEQLQLMDEMAEMDEILTDTDEVAVVLYLLDEMLVIRILLVQQEQQTPMVLEELVGLQAEMVVVVVVDRLDLNM